MKHITITLSYNMTEKEFRAEHTRDMIRDIRSGKALKVLLNEEEGMLDSQLTIKIK